jgi:hypothetical protein
MDGGVIPTEVWSLLFGVGALIALDVVVSLVEVRPRRRTRTTWIAARRA